MDEACREANRRRDRERYATDERRREYLQGKAREASRERGFMPKSSRPLRRCRICDDEFIPATGKQIYCSWTCGLVAADMRDGRGGGILRWQLATPAERDAMLAALVTYRQSPKAELRATRYGQDHIAERRLRLDDRGPDARCARCNGPLPGDESLIDLDHDDEDASRYLGLSHRRCNRARVPVVAELFAS